MSNSPTITFRLHPDMKAWLETQAAQRSVPVSDILREIIAAAGSTKPRVAA
jgi:predicted DNA-binding protein